MPRVDCVRSTKIKRSGRVAQLAGMFDVPPTERGETRWSGDAPIEDREWSIGLIVGPSGSGKSTIARELFGDRLVDVYAGWPSDAAVVDGFPKGMPIREITGALSRVGFSSPPAWMRPFGTLSNGEQFRAGVARALAVAAAAGPGATVAIDEFTSVVDRTVAKIASAAIAKSVRAGKGRLVAVSCHYDIIDWLQPDWTLEPVPGGDLLFDWRSVQPRPAIELEIRRADERVWSIFAPHHYLSAKLTRGCECYIGLVAGELAAFVSCGGDPRMARYGPGRRERRTVVLPDYQGAGVGACMVDSIAAAYRARGYRWRVTTSHPAIIFTRAKSRAWRMIRPPGLLSGNSQRGSQALTEGRSADLFAPRPTAGFEFVGAPRPDYAELLGVPFPSPRAK